MIVSLLAIFWPWLSTLLAIPTIIWFVLYLLPQIFMCLRPVPNLKTKYNAEWALVTGSGTGIGRSLAFLLARQGLNVVLVSLDDEHLKKTKADLQTAFPKQQFRSVGVNFAPGVKYMDAIRKETANIAIKIVFCNAGFMVTGFIDQTPIEKLLANIECNTTSAVNVAHHFVQIMIRERYQGCVVFTSSVAAFIPAPFAVMYASTKAFVSQFAACLHIETKALGIDVCAIHPSPVASHFYNKLDHKVDLIEAAAKNAVAPDDITNDIVKSIGACALRDLGGLAWSTRMGTFFIPYNAFAELFALAAPMMPDWKVHNKNR
jgi:short-subunit dehydrogenase